MFDSSYEEVLELHRNYIMPTYSSHLMLVKGEGCYVWDHTGKKYLDFSSGISVCNLGHCHPAITEVIHKQSAKLVHTSNLFINEHQPRLAERLVNHCFDGVVFFGNSGAEANEGLIKFARKWGSETGKNEIICMENSFHGRTLATLAATGRSKYRKGFAPDMPGFKFVPFNNIEELEKAINEKTAAVFLEPVQGEGGVIPAVPDYLRQVRALCDEKQILLLFDEVQTGIGRTGYFYGWQSYGVEPDALSLAKALGNGFPIGAFIVKRQFAHVLGSGTHASTFGGSPLACAVGCAVIDTIRGEKLLANSQKQSHYIKQSLLALQTAVPSIKDIRTRGLMIGIELNLDAKEILPLLHDRGLIAITAGENVLRLLPPLIVTQEQIDEALSIVRESIGG